MIAKCVIITIEKNPINYNVSKEKHKRKFSKLLKLTFQSQIYSQT